MTTAIDVLQHLVRRDWDVHASVPPIGDADWAAVVQRALDHGVAGLLCRALVNAPPAGVPVELCAAARVHLDDCTRQGEARVRNTFDVLDALAAAAVPALTFKGMALAALAHGDARIRPSRDIDVLVARGDMPRAVDALAALGYRLTERFGPRVMEACFATYGQDILHCAGRLPVEPHWTFAPSTLAIDVDLEAIWGRSIELIVAGRPVRTLAPEHALLVACVHGTKESWWRLLWVADVAALVHRQPDMNWDRVLADARRAGLLRVVCLGTELARRLFGTAVPAELSNLIARDRRCAGLADTTVASLCSDQRIAASPFRLSRYHWHARERLRDRYRYLWRTLTTPQSIHYRMVALPDGWVRAYVPVKIVHDYVLLPLWRVGRRPWTGSLRAR